MLKEYLKYKIIPMTFNRYLYFVLHTYVQAVCEKEEMYRHVIDFSEIVCWLWAKHFGLGCNEWSSYTVCADIEGKSSFVESQEGTEESQLEWRLLNQYNSFIIQSVADSLDLSLLSKLHRDVPLSVSSQHLFKENSWDPGNMQWCEQL